MIFTVFGLSIPSSNYDRICFPATVFVCIHVIHTAVLRWYSDLTANKRFRYRKKDEIRIMQSILRGTAVCVRKYNIVRPCTPLPPPHVI